MIYEKLSAMIAEQFNVDVQSLSEDTSFVEDLNADSLDLVELMMAIEEEFELPEIQEGILEQVKTIADAVSMIRDVVGE